MKNLLSSNRNDLIIGGIAILCLLLSSNLFSTIMPSSMVMLLIGLFVASFGLFAILVWRENPADEREAHIILSADRFGFLAGAIILSAGLVLASIRHQSTSILALALSSMILAKLIGKYLHR